MKLEFIYKHKKIKLKTPEQAVKYPNLSIVFLIAGAFQIAFIGNTGITGFVLFISAIVLCSWISYKQDIVRGYDQAIEDLQKQFEFDNWD